MRHFSATMSVLLAVALFSWSAAAQETSSDANAQIKPDEPAPNSVESETVKEVQPPEPIKIDERVDAAAYETLHRKYDELEGLNLDLVEQNRRLQQELDAVHEAAGHVIFGAGLSLMVPTDGGNDVGFGFEANLYGLYGHYYVKQGGGFGLMSTWNIAGYVRLHLIGLGAFFYEEGPLSAKNLDRGWDLTVSSGLDVRIWEGIEIRARATWFIPNPVALYDMGKDKVSDAAQKVKDQIGGGDLSGANDLNPGDFANEALGSVGDALLEALKAPRIEFGVRWEF